MHVPEPDGRDAPPPSPSPAADLPVPPARLWAILYGAEATADELAYIRGREALRRIACAVLRERNDPRLHLFEQGD